MRLLPVLITIAVTTPLITSGSGQVSLGAPSPMAPDRFPHTVVFPLTLPNSGQPHFARLSLSFTVPDSPNQVARFPADLQTMQVFMGTPGQLGTAIALQDRWIDETGTLWLEFKSPLAAGTRLTIICQQPKAIPTPAITYAIAAYPTTTVSGAVFVNAGILPASR